MNDKTEKATSGEGTRLTASATLVRHPDRHYDERGIVIGPWSDSVKRTNALLRSVRRTRT